MYWLSDILVEITLINTFHVVGPWIDGPWTSTNWTDVGIQLVACNPAVGNNRFWLSKLEFLESGFSEAGSLERLLIKAEGLNFCFLLLLYYPLGLTFSMIYFSNILGYGPSRANLFVARCIECIESRTKREIYATMSLMRLDEPKSQYHKISSDAKQQ